MGEPHPPTASLTWDPDFTIRAVKAMGEAKRRSIQGLPPKLVKPKRPKEIDTSPRIASWLPLTRNQADRFVTLTTKGAWIGIGALALFWVTVRFVGPAAGWWSLSDG